MKTTNPFQISVPFNQQMKCHELHLQVGNLSEKEARLLADALSEWLTEESGWKAKVQ
jgi:hypothetical protein